MKKQSLIVQLSVYFFIVLSCVLLAVSVIQYHNGRTIIRNMTESATRNALNNSATYISEYVGKLKTIATVVAENDKIVAYAQKDNEQSKDDALTFIEELIQTDQHLVAAVLVTKDGRLLSNDTELEMKTSSDMMKETWYQQAIKEHTMPVLTSAHQLTLSDNQTDWVISVTKEVIDKQGHNLGVVRIDINYQAIENYLKQLDFGQEGYAFIIDEQHEFVYHPNKASYTMPEMMDTDLIKSNQSGYMNNGQYFIERATIPNSRWQIIALVALKEVARLEKQLLFSFIVVGCIVLIVAIIGLIYLLKYWRRPIVQLQTTMSQVEQGNLQVRANVDGPIEFQQLIQHFNRMLDQQLKLMSDIKATEQTARNYELQALSSQINPHFLYNTLETIIWMAEFNDSQSVVDLTQSLAKYFRLALNQGNELSHLSNEIEHIKMYLFIQQQRYGDKLQYTIDTIDDMEQLPLPKLILQPIVENAIYHGIKEITRSAVIKISVEQTDTHIIVKVYDNGQGMKPQTLEQLRANILSLDEQSPHSVKKLGGVGLRNVNHRLQLFFKANYMMEIDSEWHQFTCVTLFLPKNEPH